MYITEQDLSDYLNHLVSEERSNGTIERYRRIVGSFARWVNGREVSKDVALSYKAQLTKKYAAAGTNTCIAALNGFFAFMDWAVRLKPLKIQRQTFCTAEKELTQTEYRRLLHAARAQNNERLYLLIQTICSVGIRVSELRYITVEAAKTGRAEIANKGKIRTVFLPEQLKAALLRYAKKCGVMSGSVFITRGGRPLDRSNIWSDMKKLCTAAGVAPEKVFPHNLRRLFARTFYGIDRDIARLADILGHSHFDTTRIYLTETGREHRKRMERVGAVLLIS